MVPKHRHADLLARLAPAAIRRLHPLLHTLIPPQSLRTGATDPIAEALKRSMDTAGAAKWKASSPALPAEVEDLLARPVDVGSGMALLELRFRGLDPAFPFVEVVGTDFDVGLAEVPALIAAAKASWPAIPLRALGLWVGSHIGWQPPGEADIHLVVGALSDLELLPSALTTTTASLDSLPRVQSAYAHFHTASPLLAPHVNPVEHDDLAEMIAAGTAVDAWLEGKWAGMLAVKSTPLMGVAAWEVYEEILAPEFRGRGLGVALQRAGLAALPAGEESVVWGTIHHRNVPSRRTAARVGRQEVDLRWFVPI